MMLQSNAATFELGEIKLALKPGLRFKLRQGRHEQWYLVEDSLRGNFFRIGKAEYLFLTALDGQTTLATAVARVCTTLGASSFSEQEAIRFSNWLVETGLAVTNASASSQRFREKLDREHTKALVQRVNPISIRFNLFNPDRILTQLASILGWVFSWPMAIVWLVVCSYAACLIAYDWTRVITDAAAAFSRDNWLWMALSWLGLKLIHESAHGLSCKRFGGTVDRCGVLFLLFIPLPFVDLTSAWKFDSKYKRILTSAAGMLAEIFIASLAAIVWLQCEPGLWRTILGNLMVAASIHTLLFNANPLLRFDGYHILADWLEIPNLGNHASQWLSGLTKQIFLGTPREPFSMTGFRGQLVRFYGVAAFAWKLCLLVTLTIAAANLLPGFGLLIALFGAIVWIAIPTGRFLHRLVLEQRPQYAYDNRARVRLVASLTVVGLIVVGLGYLPGPTVIKAPFVIDYAKLEVVRANSAGFLTQVHVKPGQQVQRGELLATLVNQELLADIASLECQLEQAKIQGRAVKTAGDIARWQFEKERITQLQQQLDELNAQREGLRIESPEGGIVLTDNLPQRLGTYCRIGDEVMAIGDEQSKEAIGMIPQQDAEHLPACLASKLQLRVWGNPVSLEGILSEISPRSRDDLPHFSFAGVYGGPLEVLNREATEDQKNLAESDAMKLVESRIQVVVQLGKETSRGVRAGQVGQLFLRGRAETLGTFVVTGLTRWVKKKTTLNHGL